MEQTSIANIFILVIIDSRVCFFSALALSYQLPFSLYFNICVPVRFEVFTAVTMKNVVFWDVKQCGSCKNWRSTKTSVLTRASRRNIAEDGILHMRPCFSLWHLLMHLLPFWYTFQCWRYWTCRPKSRSSKSSFLHISLSGSIILPYIWWNSPLSGSS
jgi:hypothetical protein